VVSRPFDSGAQIGSVHGAEQMQTTLDEPGETRVPRDVS
jgi:hypothetical protein